MYLNKIILSVLYVSIRPVLIITDQILLTAALIHRNPVWRAHVMQFVSKIVTYWLIGTYV